MAHRRSIALAAAAWAVLASPLVARGEEYDWLTLQAGKFTGHSSTTGDRDLTQTQFGVRLHTGIGDTPFWENVSEVAVLKCQSGWFADFDFLATWQFNVGSLWLQPAMSVGIPIGMVGNPYYFSGWDVTWGGGLTARMPVGPLKLEARGQASFNFLSYLSKLNGDPYDAGGDGRPGPHGAMLLYRVVAAAWIPLGRQELRLEVRRDSFNKFRMTGASLGMAF
ncbi:MAG: hypothetical protein QM704_04910 [Anaeromyxobacteraceae bacterium]